MEQKKKNELVIDDALKWHFFNLYCMALSDDVFDITEKQMLYTIGIEHGFTSEEINNVVMTANITPVIPEKLEDKIESLYDLVRMAWADGKVVKEERDVLKKCVVRYGFLQDNADAIVEYFIESVKNGKNKEEIINEING